ncbi:adenylate kinase 8 isoform X1 [Zootoca vivipara]|uniref:adenylate kinase 8 isoform X1 n=2 Tax=Zootoca vivipara TaxID=8524 RepID=UPI0015903EE1|nr:adenylate kinase 8 isoform X1 [Zootoca vivipara]
MDATRRPIHIPPQMGLYAEKHRLHQIMQEMLQGLLIHKPEEPIDFLIKQLNQDNYDVPKICILGPPASGKTTIAMWLCKQLGTARISPETLLNSTWSDLRYKAEEYQDTNQNIPGTLWAELIGERLQIEDCIHSGWIMEGIPQSRELARELQGMGIIPKHVVVLFAPDVVLIERNLGKRVDICTGEVYHTTFDWPTENYIRQRLMVPHGISEVETARRLLKYHQDYPGIRQSFGYCMKLINADQPCADVFAQVFTHVQAPPRTLDPFSPRILLCGPPGSGKSMQAMLLSQKYGIINVCCGQLLKEAVADETKLGELIKPYFDSGWPVADNIVVKMLSERLNMLDCHTRGWVLHGFPRDEDQANLMQRANINPNRVFFLHITPESILERLCYRMLDPVTGERYHTLYQPSASKEASDRLLIHPRDLEEAVKLKVDAYLRIAEGLETCFEDAIFINGDQDPQTVFEYIESYIVNPRPTTVGLPQEMV